MPWPKGVPFSDEHRAKINASRKGRVLSDETRAKIGISGTGRKHTDEARAKMSVAKKGRPLSTSHLEATIQGQADYYRGHLTTSEQKMADILEEGGIRFQAQVAIWKYIVDFLIWPNVVLEVDGRIHRSVERQRMDTVRDEVLKALGFTVIRVKVEDLSVS